MKTIVLSIHRSINPKHNKHEEDNTKKHQNQIAYMRIKRKILKSVTEKTYYVKKNKDKDDRFFPLESMRAIR